MRMKILGLVLTSTALLFAGAFGCSDDGDDSGSSSGNQSSGGSGGSGHQHEGACGEIEEACAGKDDGSDPEITACHALAHDGPEETCEAMEEECIEHCGGEHHEHEGEEHEHEGEEHEHEEGTGGTAG